MIGHRGASGYRPEHSRAAYELALELGVDAVEPDLVASKDGVLVIRHENEISGTTDVAAHPEFAGKRTTKRVDGITVTGWFTEDFTWQELSTLRVIERLPEVRQTSASFDGSQPMLRLSDLLDIIDAQPRPIILVAEIKHPTYFASIGLPLDELFANEIAAWARDDNLIVESFEQSVLLSIRHRGIRGRLVFLAEATGSPPDLVAEFGDAALTYEEHLTDTGLAQLAAAGIDGISVDKQMLMTTDAAGRPIAARSLAERAHAVGLTVYCWTLRAENRFLAPAFRRGDSPSEFGDWRSEFQLLLDTGVDGVFADQPDLVFDALGGAEPRGNPDALGSPGPSPRRRPNLESVGDDLPD